MFFSISKWNNNRKKHKSLNRAFCYANTRLVSVRQFSTIEICHDLTQTLINNINSFKNICSSLIRPNLENISNIWSSFYGTQVQRLEKVQNKFIWFITYKINIPAQNILYEQIQITLNLPTLHKCVY